MKLNWKVMIGLVVLVGVLTWGISSLRTRSYSGTDLDFDVGSGPVTVTNSEDAAVPVQLVGTGARSFEVSSITEGVSGTSERQGSGRTATQLYAFDLPAGVTELMIAARSSEVSFVASTGSRLEVTVQPLGESDSRTTMIVAAIGIVGALFYISRSTGHRWLGRTRREKTPIPAAQPQKAKHISDSYLES